MTVHLAQQPGLASPPSSTFILPIWPLAPPDTPEG